jgi:transmembrane sensor
MSDWTKPGPETAPDQAAIAWWSRLQSGEATEDEVSALRLWLARAPAHEAAWARTAKAWHGVAPLAASSLRLRPARRTWLAYGGGLAAALALALVLTPSIEALGADHRTAAGEVRSVVLPDGGTAWIDTDSIVDLDYSSRERRVTLRRGQAWFDVAKDARPFVVTAGRAEITDIGTVFGVRREARRVSVAVSSGEVRIACAGGIRSLRPGEGAACAAGQLDGGGAVDIAAMTAWRQGRLTFVDRPVGEVLDEVARYLPGPVWVRLDPETRGRRVTALFELSDLALGLNGLAQSSDLTIDRLGPVTIVRQDRPAG